MPRDERDVLLCFIHVPKTAGTVVRSVMRRNNPGVLNSKPADNVFKGGGGASPKALQAFRAPRALNLDGVRAIHGHYPLGIRRYLEPALPDRTLRYFTFVREPVDRSISHYFHVLSGATDRDDEPEGLEPLPPNATIDDALEAGFLHDNLQTRMLSGSAEPFGDVTEEMLAQAKANLRDTMTLVGITERMDESLVLAKLRLGFPSLLVDFSQRVNPNRPRGPDVDSRLRRTAERVNAFDMELYRYAVDLFDSAPEHQELEFHVELAALRTAKAGGEAPVTAPVSPKFDGGDREWRMLVAHRAARLQLEARRAARNVKRAEAEAEALAAADGQHGLRRLLRPLMRATEHA